MSTPPRATTRTSASVSPRPAAPGKPAAAASGLSLPASAMDRLRALADELDRPVADLFQESLERGLTAFEAGAVRLDDYIGQPVDVVVADLAKPVRGDLLAVDDDHVVVNNDRRPRFLPRAHIRSIHLRDALTKSLR